MEELWDFTYKQTLLQSPFVYTRENNVLKPSSVSLAAQNTVSETSLRFNRQINKNLPASLDARAAVCSLFFREKQSWKRLKSKDVSELSRVI